MEAGSFDKENIMGEKDILISREKVASNLKRYGWIILLGFIAGIGGMLLLAKHSSGGTKADSAKGLMYQSDVLLYIEQETDDNIFMYSQYTLVATNYASLINSSAVLNSLNDRLEAEGYKTLHDGDFIDANAMSGNIVVLSVVSTDIPERTKFMANELAELILEFGDERFSVVDSYILDGADVYETAEIKDGFYRKKYNAPDESGTGEENESGIGGLDLSKKDILVLAMGVLAGMAVVLLIIILDKKIYKKEDVEQFSKILYLGDYTNDEDSDAEMAAATAKRCELLGTKNLAVVTLNADRARTKEELDRLFNGISLKVHNGRQLDGKALDNIHACDGVVFYLACGRDNINEFEDLNRKIDMVQGKVFGYILDKTKRK